MLYEVLKTAKMGAGKAPDLYTALLAKNLRRDGEVKTLSGIPPLTFSSNGQPLLDYLISGNTVQSGTPTPDSPVMPEGTGERTGNLFDSNTVYSTYEQSDGTYRGTVNNFYTTHVTPFTSDDIGKTFTFTIVVKETTSTNVRASANINGTAVNGNNLSIAGTTTVTFTVSSVNDYLYLGYGGGGANTIILDNIMLNLGSEAFPYEPYGYKIPILSAGQTTPVYLGEVETTRKIKKLVLDGTEGWFVMTESGTGKKRAGHALADGRPSSVAISSHYQYVSGQAYPNVDYFSINSTSYLLVGINTNIPDAAAFKSYLAAQYANGTPVCVWYVLATEETSVVNEPLHKIGDYADTVSMEQAGIEIPTVRGTNTIDVLTDVKPSEIYIKYQL